MSTRKDYGAGEWQIIARAPEYVGNYIIFADLGVTTVVKELKALAEAIEGTAPPPDAQTLVADVVDVFKAAEASLHPEDKKAEDEAADAALGPDHQAGIRAELGKAIGAIRRTGGDAEAAAFGTWLMALGLATAEAAREGGILKIGSTRVSDKEKAALAELEAILGSQAQ